MSLLGKLAAKSAGFALDAAKQATDADAWLQLGMGGLIETAKARAEESPTAYSDGPLRLLFAGYCGSRNTGADVRVEEMLRQFKHVLGEDRLESTVLTLDPSWTRGYFRGSRQVTLPKVFPKFLFDEVHKQHGVVACEGSMFKSKFADALTTMMAGSLGLAIAEKKLAIGYGGEAGEMTERTERFVRRYAKGSYVIARNTASAKKTELLGLRTDVGTDTAWTFGTQGTRGHDLLAREGWDGTSKVIGIAPIHPFWWPVKPSLRKALAHELTGAHNESHFDSLYFHNDGPEVAQKFKTYIGQLRTAILEFQRQHHAFVVLIGMEAVDRVACEALQKELPFRVPMFISDEHDMYDMVPVLRSLDLLVSSRFHAIVCAMPHLVPSIGVTMDERIRNLMASRNESHLSFEVDAPQLGEHLAAAMKSVFTDATATRANIERSVFEHLESMGRMGGMLADYVRQESPRFGVNSKFGRHADPWLHLPVLPQRQREIVRKHGGNLSQTGWTGAVSEA